MKKRIFAAMLAASLAAVSFASCGGSNSGSTTSTDNGGSTTASTSTDKGGETASTGSDGSSDAPYTITMAYLGGSEQPDAAEVHAAIDELTMNELNMHWEGIQLSFGDFTDRLRLMLTGGDKLDILFLDDADDILAGVFHCDTPFCGAAAYCPMGLNTIIPTRARDCQDCAGWSGKKRDIIIGIKLIMGGLSCKTIGSARMRV